LNQLFNDTRGNWKGLLTHSREFLVMFANQIHQ
jgi:hypothetical protein